MLHRRPRLLFLAHSFPPLRATACTRTWNIAKYLARLGWDVTVITPHPSVWKYVDNPEKVEADLKEEGIRRILTDHRWRFLDPGFLNCWNQGFGWFAGGVCRRIARHFGIDGGIGWIKSAKQACSTLTANDVDIILATGTPFSAFKLAKYLSNRLDRPYVLDYRDPWTGYPYLDQPAKTATVREESRLLADCAAVTIVSRSLASALENRFNLGSKLHVLTNGFDPEEMTDVIPHDFGHFAIVYAGHFYPPKSVISPIMAALKRLRETMNCKGDKWYFHYYGRYGIHVHEEARRFGVRDRVILHGNVPRSEALSAVRGAGVVVVITSIFEKATLEDNGVVTSKVFEALGLGTPILLIAPSGSDARAIAESSGLAQSFTGSDIDGMVSFLKNLMFGYRTIKSENPETYTWPNIAKRLDSILRTAAGMVSQRKRVS